MGFCLKEKILMREGRRPTVYSVSFPDPTSTLGVREDLAVGMVANVAIGEGVLVRNDFDRVSIFDRPILNATWNTQKGRWEAFTMQGEQAFTWRPQEPYREVLYRCRPFWYRLENGEHGLTRVSVSPDALEGFTLAPMFKNGRDFVYRPVFEMALGSDGLPHSRAGLAVTRGIGLTTVMDQARSYDPRARVESVDDWFSDALLQLVEFARWDLHTLMRGNCGALAKSGVAAQSVSASSGCIEDGKPLIWRGKENAWQNVCSFLCDILLQKHIAADGSYTSTICRLRDMSRFDGTLNAHYEPLAPYFPSLVRGELPVGAFALQNGLFYPALEATGNIAPKAYAYIQSQWGEEYPIMVGVGGGTAADMIPTTRGPSPFHWEAVQRTQSRENRFGGRLILDEA